MVTMGLIHPTYDNHFDYFMTFFTIMLLIVLCFGSSGIPFVDRNDALMSYSKFAKSVKGGGTIPSRIGMLLLCLPSAVIGIYYFSISKYTTDGTETEQCHMLLSLMLTLHFSKRVLECLFLHKFSETMSFASSFFISFAYAIIACATCIYSHPMTSHVKGDTSATYSYSHFDVVLFLVGSLGTYQCSLLTNAL